MTQIICDICGKPILKGECRAKYRIQKRNWISVFYAEWDELDVHAICMDKLMDLIRKEQKNAEN